jgi:hypothetical protein
VTIASAGCPPVSARHGDNFFFTPSITACRALAAALPCPL